MQYFTYNFIGSYEIGAEMHLKKIIEEDLKLI